MYIYIYIYIYIYTHTHILQGPLILFVIIVFHISINIEVHCHCFKNLFSYFLLSFRLTSWAQILFMKVKIYPIQQTKKYNTHQCLTLAIHLKIKMKSIQLFELLRELKCYFFLVDVPNLVKQLDITQSFFKIRVCIFIISLFCIFAFRSNNFTKNYILYHRF